MFNEVKIGSKVVPMLSMSSVDVYYRNVFHEDPIKLQADASNDPGAMVTFYIKMAFIMAKFAEFHDRKKMATLNEDSYIEWLDQFDRMDMMNALEDVMLTYNGQMVTTSEAKKNNDEQTEK